MIVKVIHKLGNRMETQTEKIQEMFNKDLEELKNKQTEMSNTITEMKNTLEEANSRREETVFVSRGVGPDGPQPSAGGE